MFSRGPGIILLLLLLSLSLASCGGGGSAIAPADTDNSGGNHETLSLEQWLARNHNSSRPQSETALPAFPVEDPNDARTVSGDSDRSVAGDEYLLENGSLIVGDGSIVINGAPTFAEENFPGWALYKIGGLSGLRADSLNIECVPQGMNQRYWVGVADFTHLRWQWFGPVAIPEYQLDLSEEQSRYVSNLGNLYFVLVCQGDNQARHYRSTVVANAGGSLPGAPSNLYASKGEFPDGVALSWEVGAGADYYEVYRRLSQNYYPGGDPLRGNDDGTMNHGGDPLDPEDEIAWEHIGQSWETSFFDYQALPDVIYEYRVRAINDVGASGYSNVDWGFVYGNGGGGDHQLQGYCYGYSDSSGGGQDGDPGNDGGGDDGNGGNGGPFGGDIFPLAGVMLTVINADGSYMATMQSDGNGFYYFDELPPGFYSVTPELPEWAFDPTTFFFEVSPNVPGVWADFIGSYVGGGGGGGDRGIHGYVWSNEGEPNGQLVPLAEATVRVTEVQSGVTVAEFLTGSDGWYQFLQLNEGSYELSCEKWGWDFGDSRYFFEVINGVPDLQFDFYGTPVP